MSNIEESAFQIARYLVENRNKFEQAEIQKDLSISSEDFNIGIGYLAPKYFRTGGQPGRKIIIQINWGELHNFVNRIKENRVQLSLDEERLLKFLFNSSTPASDSEQIMISFEWDEKRHLNVLDALKFNEYIDIQYADNKPFDIWITDKGRNVVRNNFRLLPQQVRAVNIGNIGNNSIVNIGSILHSVNQSIQANSYLSLSDKQEIDSLLKGLVDALKQLPPENADEAEAVEEMAKDLVENATREKPNKKLIEISAEGLKKAAKDLSIIIPSVLLISEKLISFIFALHR